MYKIPTISLEDTDRIKWQTLCNTLEKPGKSQAKTWAASCWKIANNSEAWPDEP